MIPAKAKIYKWIDGFVLPFTHYLLILLFISGCNFAHDNDPLIGKWMEKAQTTCDSSVEVVSSTPIGELDFRKDGTFSVTWHPFETYRDYWGDYEYNLQSGVIELNVTGGNYIPQRLDTSGKILIDGSEKLILKGVWLGHPQRSQDSINCGYIFERFSS